MNQSVSPDTPDTPEASDHGGTATPVHGTEDQASPARRRDHDAPIPPHLALPTPVPARILLLGSGELGRELVISFKRLGAHVIAADSYPHAPAMQVADEHRVLDMTSASDLHALLDSVDVDLVVPEVEAIATDALVDVEQAGGVRVVPNAFSVRATMDRQRIRALASSLPGVATSCFRFASSAQEVREALDVVGLPAFVKPTMSSSGHGQSRLTSASEAEEAWRVAEEGARSGTGRVIVEEGIDFDSEITLLTVRWWDDRVGKVRTSFCAPVGHRQEDGDYVESWQPAEISPLALEAARSMALAVTAALAQGGAAPALGLFGVEFFVRGDRVWFSELSPRPHDTGMVTMVTQLQSEFDLHAHAVLGLPVDTELETPGASAVVRAPARVGDAAYTGVARALALGGDVRLFGKEATRAGRRLGVALARGEDVATGRRLAREMAGQIQVVPGEPR